MYYSPLLLLYILPKSLSLPFYVISHRWWVCVPSFPSLVCTFCFYLPVSFQTFDHLHTSPFFFPTKTQLMSVAHHLHTPPLPPSPLLSLSFSLTNRQHWQWSGVGHGETSARGPWAAAGSDQVHKEGASVALQRLQKREIRSFIEMFCHKGHFFWDVISLSV